jgi:hypothetical protein
MHDEHGTASTPAARCSKGCRAPTCSDSAVFSAVMAKMLPSNAAMPSTHLLSGT